MLWMQCVCVVVWCPTFLCWPCASVLSVIWIVTVIFCVFFSLFFLVIFRVCLFLLSCHCLLKKCFLNLDLLWCLCFFPALSFCVSFAEVGVLYVMPGTQGSMVVDSLSSSLLANQTSSMHAELRSIFFLLPKHQGK